MRTSGSSLDAKLSALSPRATEFLLDLSLAEPTVEARDAAISKAFHAAKQAEGDAAARQLMREVSTFGAGLPVSFETLQLVATFVDIRPVLQATYQSGYTPPEPKSTVPGDWLGT